MKKIMLPMVFVTGLVLAGVLGHMFGFPENSASRLLKSIGKIDELKVFPLPNNGENSLFTTRDTHVIQGFFDAIEFKRFSQSKAIYIKEPGVLELVVAGVETQRLQWVVCGWGYLRADNGLLRGDVELTEESSQKLAGWLEKQGIEVPKRGPPPKFIKSK